MKERDDRIRCEQRRAPMMRGELGNEAVFAVAHRSGLVAKYSERVG